MDDLIKFGNNYNSNFPKVIEMIVKDNLNSPKFDLKNDLGHLHKVSNSNK